MSLLNVWIEPNRALVGVDTQTVVQGEKPAAVLGLKDGARFDMSKLLVLPHAEVVMAGRGSPGFLGFVFKACHQKPNGDFDALARAMPQVLRDVHASLRNHLRGQLPAVDLDRFDQQEIVLVGWSSLKGRMDGTVYVQAAGKTGFDVVAPPYWVAPWSEQGEPIEPKGHAEMQTLARQQVDYMRAVHPAIPIGGRLVVAELTWHSIAITSTDLEA